MIDLEKLWCDGVYVPYIVNKCGLRLIHTSDGVYAVDEVNRRRGLSSKTFVMMFMWTISGVWFGTRPQLTVDVCDAVYVLYPVTRVCDWDTPTVI